MTDLKNILSDGTKASDPSNSLLYDFSEGSASATFYFRQFKVENVAKLKEDGSTGTIPPEMVSIMELFRTKLHTEAILVELGGSWHQNRSGDPYRYFSNYF